jgi:hypothetical protein
VISSPQVSWALYLICAIACPSNSPGYAIFLQVFDSKLRTLDHIHGSYLLDFGVLYDY